MHPERILNSRKNVVKIEHFWTGSELGLYPSRNGVSYSHWGRFSIGNKVGFSAITPNTTSTDVWSILVLIGFSDLRRNTIRCGHHLRHHPKGSPPIVTLTNFRKNTILSNMLYMITKQLSIYIEYVYKTYRFY